MSKSGQPSPAPQTGSRQVAVVTAVVVAVLIAAAVIVGIVYTKNKNAEAHGTVLKAYHASATYPTKLDRANATVLVGQPSAKVTVDAYEDFLCPVCGEFEARWFPAIDKQLAAGKIKVRYHLLNLLDEGSTPKGYSTQSANTALAVAQVAPEKFLDYHLSLFKQQPSEGGPGWTQKQLSELAGSLGVKGPAFDRVVKTGAYDKQIAANLAAAVKNKKLWQTSAQGTGFGTPTVVVNGKVVDVRQPNWLDKAVKTS